VEGLNNKKPRGVLTKTKRGWGGSNSLPVFDVDSAVSITRLVDVVPHREVDKRMPSALRLARASRKGARSQPNECVILENKRRTSWSGGSAKEQVVEGKRESSETVKRGNQFKMQ